MIFSEIALEVLALSVGHEIKSRAHFWKDFSDIDRVSQTVAKKENIRDVVESLRYKMYNNEDDSCGILCAFDEDFPQINSLANNADKPYLLFYRGDKGLLQNLNNNVAVIGLINPTYEIEQREIAIVKRLIEKGIVIVSGLANGCDEIAHRTCVENNAKTIAILPSTLSKISPASNRKLAERIVEQGGLLLSEYFNEPSSRYEAAGRYIERDRLQALFSKFVIMIASYLQGVGDSGSRHAMSYAEKYGIDRYVMYNNETDGRDEQFALNKKYINEKKASILSHSAIDIIASKVCEKLIKQPRCKQLKFF